MAQTITATKAVRDGSAEFELYGADESNEISLSGVQDEKVVIIVQNDNDSVAVNTASITVKAGGYWRKDIGDFSVDLVDGGKALHIGPLDSARFEGTDSNITIDIAVTQSGSVSSCKIGVINLP